MKSRLTKVQNTISSRLIKVKENMETRLGDIISLLDRIPAIINISGNQGRDEAQASRAQAIGGAQVVGGGQGTGGAQADRAQANETQADRA